MWQKNPVALISLMLLFLSECDYLCFLYIAYRTKGKKITALNFWLTSL